MSLYVISDLHLSTNEMTNKSMENSEQNGKITPKN